MKLLLLLVAIVAARESVLDFPFYFSLPKESIDSEMECELLPYPSLFQGSKHEDSVGLRLITVPNGPGQAERKRARRAMGRDLARSGHLKDGDIVLTFRPEMQDSMAYPHIQMGITHAGLVYTADDGQAGVAAFNIDSPLDHLYMGQFDSAHYAGAGSDPGTDSMHIVRPRKLDARKRANLKAWIKELKKNLRRFNGSRRQLKFQSDYMAPRFAALQSTTRATVTTLGKILLEKDQSTKLPMYCSEFAWHMLSLAGCHPDDFSSRSASSGEGLSCVEEIFAPMPLTAASQTDIGLADGPLINLLQLSNKEKKIHEIFCSGDYTCANGAHMSSGHRKVAEQVAPLMAGLEQLFSVRVASGGWNERVPLAAAQLNAPIPNNYSPTGFLVQAMAKGERGADYVATVQFIAPRDLAKARRLAIAQNPKCGGKENGPRVEVENAGACIRDAARVKRAQNHLIFHGESISADGAWGRNTHAALNRVQRKFNQKVTDCLTEEAYTLLEGTRNSGSSSSGSSGCSKTCIQSKEQKKEAQRKLGVSVDGLWGRGSQGALNAHQARNGNEKTSCLTGCALAQL